MSNKDQMRRRDLFKAAAGAGGVLAVPYFFATPRSLGAELAADKINIGLIGAGGMGLGNLNAAKDWVNLVAVADPDRRRCDKANESLGGGKAGMYADYRGILDRTDIDILHIATPDHWHAKPLIEAMYAGKDVYCEKPLTLTIDEGKLIRKVQKETGRIVQVGTQQRSTFGLFTKAMALVAEGRVGKIQRIEARIDGAPSSPALPVASAPSELDWDRWLGPAPQTDYRYLWQEPKENEERGRSYSNGHYEFRWWYEFSGGKLTDWGAHHVDIANWALKLNGQTEGPVSIDGTAEHPVDFENGEAVQKDRYNTATKFNFTVKYPGGTEVIIRHDGGNGVMITGDKGRIFVNRGKLTGKPVEELVDNPLPEDAISKVYKGHPMVDNERRAHWANFLHCVREQKEPISDVHSHMEMLNVCHLAGIAGRLGRGFKWDNQTEQVVGDDVANSMLSRPYRKGYEIEMG